MLPDQGHGKGLFKKHWVILFFFFGGLMLADCIQSLARVSLSGRQKSLSLCPSSSTVQKDANHASGFKM
jgi:hypothetical protein